MAAAACHGQLPELADARVSIPYPELKKLWEAVRPATSEESPAPRSPPFCCVPATGRSWAARWRTWQLEAPALVAGETRPPLFVVAGEPGMEITTAAPAWWRRSSALGQSRESLKPVVQDATIPGRAASD